MMPLPGYILSPLHLQVAVLRTEHKRWSGSSIQRAVHSGESGASGHALEHHSDVSMAAIQAPQRPLPAKTKAGC